jgi:hypothetical protein
MSPAVDRLLAKAFGAVVDCGLLLARPAYLGHGIYQPDNLSLSMRRPLGVNRLR